MSRHRILLFPLLLAAALPAAAQLDADQLALAAQQFALDRAHDARRLMVGPQQPSVAPIAATETCESLYTRRLAIMRAQLNYKPSFYADPRNSLAIVIGTFFEPAYYTLAYTGLTGYTDRLHKNELTAELDALRYASAERHCFVY